MISAYPYILYLGIPLLGALAYWRWVYYKEPVYRYSSVLPLRNLLSAGTWSTLIPFCLRLVGLALLVLGLARLRTPDTRSKISVRGIDIMLVFDASGSMQAVDDRADGRTRLAIARDEAISFISKRDNDPVGLVIFSGVAVTRCPLTLDKKMLDEILKGTTVDTLPVGGTVLSDGIIMAANRLKKSKAASRIMIVLTDGAPTRNDSPPDQAISFAKKLGIKVYTIGIGSEEGGWYYDALFGWNQFRDTYNEELLEKIAQETGGRFFKASKPLELANIYETIDELEKSEQEMPVYARHFEYFIYFLWAALIVLLIELLFTTLIWVRL